MTGKGKGKSKRSAQDVSDGEEDLLDWDEDSESESSQDSQNWDSDFVPEEESQPVRSVTSDHGLY